MCTKYSTILWAPNRLLLKYYQDRSTFFQYCTSTGGCLRLYASSTVAVYRVPCMYGLRLWTTNTVLEYLLHLQRQDVETNATTSTTTGYLVLQYVHTSACTTVSFETLPEKCIEYQAKQLHSHCHYNWLATIATLKTDTEWRAKKGVNYKRNRPSTMWSWGSIVKDYKFVFLCTSGCVTVHTWPFLRVSTYLRRSLRERPFQSNSNFRTAKRQHSRPATLRACPMCRWKMKSEKGKFLFPGFLWCHDYVKSLTVNRI
jgi:hypothetical protein